MPADDSRGNRTIVNDDGISLVEQPNTGCRQARQMRRSPSAPRLRHVSSREKNAGLPIAYARGEPVGHCGF